MNRPILSSSKTSSDRAYSASLASLSSAICCAAAACALSLALGCGAPDKTKAAAGKATALGPSTPAAKKAPAPEAEATTKTADAADLQLPQGSGNTVPFDNAAKLVVGLDRVPRLGDTALPAIPVATKGSPYKGAVSVALIEELKANVARLGHRRLNVHLDARLGADVVWTVLKSATQAAITEIRIPMATGALALHSPRGAKPSDQVARAGHLALMIGEKGVNGRVFAGPSADDVFPQYASGGGRPLGAEHGRCPVGQRPASGRIPPVLTRMMGEPLCGTNGSKPYWIVVAASLSTTVDELTALGSAAATPTGGCKPRVAMATPAENVPGLTSCAGAIAQKDVASYLAKAVNQTGDKFEALRRATGKPFITKLDPSAVSLERAPELAAKLQKAAKASSARVALGRVATSDKDASRTAVSLAMKGPMAQISECYKVHLKTAGDDAFEGLMGMGFEIEPDGRVGKPGFSKQTKVPDSLKLCIAKFSPAWTFPPPAGGKKIQAMVPVVLRKPVAAKASATP